jgi:hypothetical protein
MKRGAMRILAGIEDQRDGQAVYSVIRRAAAVPGALLLVTARRRERTQPGWGRALADGLQPPEAL